MQVTDSSGNIFGPNGLQVNGSDGKPKVISSGGGGGSIPHGTASGTDTYTVSISGVTSYADGDSYLVRFTNGNTTGSTLNINGLGAIQMYRNNDGQLIGGDIQSGAEMLCVYNSTLNVFQVIGTSPNTLLAYVTNAEAITITKGQPVYAFGGQGDRLKVKLAYNTSDATSAQTVGLVLSTSIGANQKGFIILNGQLDGLSILPTSTWADGDPVYLGATPGSITKTKPNAPNHLVYLGFVTTANNGSAGRMYVRVQNGYELDELHDVQISGLADNDLLQYDLATDLWQNKSLSGAGIQPTLSLTTTGTSGAATLVGSTLNIPQYGGSSSLTVGTTPIASGTIGRVLFQGTGNVLQQSANLFWDNTNGRLGIGTATPNNDLTIIKTSTGTVQAYVKNASNGTAADARLVVVNDTNVEGGFFIGSSTRSIDASAVLVYANQIMRFMTNNTVATGGTSPIVFQAGGNNATQEAMRITGTTRVLIGTTTDAGFKLDVNGTARVSGQISLTNGSALIYPPTASTAQEGLAIYRGASTSTKALTIGITNTDEVVFNTTNADYIFNRTGTEVFNIGGGGTSIIRTRYFGSFQQAIPTGTNINFCFGTSNTSGGQRLQFGFDSNEDSVIGLRNSSLRVRQTVSNHDFININTTTGNVVIEKNTSVLTPIASAKLALNSTTEGFLPPRMTTAQKNAIATPAAGLVVYDTTLNKLCVRTASAWETITSL